MKKRFTAGLLWIVILLTGLTSCGGLPTAVAPGTPSPIQTASPVTVTPIPATAPPQATAPAAKPTAQAARLEVQSNTVSADFPKSLTFNLKANSTQDITRITLSYSVNKITVAPVVNEVRVSFEPSRDAGVQWVWDQRKGGIPGGAEVTWEWIVDTGGSRTRTEKKTFLYHDPRFDGKSSLTEGDVSLYWYGGDAAYGRGLMSAAQDALKRLAQDTGAQLTRPVKLYIYPSYEELRSALVFPQEWTGGVAFTEYGVIAIGVSPGRAGYDYGLRTVAHELTHLVTFQVTFNSYGVNMPTWLNEGLSEWAEGAPDPDRKSRVELAAKQDKLFSVKTLSSSFPAGTDDALLAYGEAESLVRFLIEKYGKEQMNAYLGLFRQGIGAEEGLQKIYGFDYNGLDMFWRVSIGASQRAQVTAPALKSGILAGG